MEPLIEFFQTLVTQFQKPTLAFLIGGLLIAAMGSKLEIPDAIYRFIVFMLLMNIGLKAGMEVREADLSALILPALISAGVGCLIVLVGRYALSRLPGVRLDDAIATSGLFGAVSASTLAAAMIVLEEEQVAFEAWAPALYPFMDIPALILAIVLAGLHNERTAAQSGDDASEGNASGGGASGGGAGGGVSVWRIVKDSLRSAAVSALLLGLALGLLTQPDRVVESFYDPLFRGLLSILMLIMGMEAYARLVELRRVAHWYAVYAVIAPITHGLIAFGLGTVAHHLTGFSPGGVILLAVMAASSSDISGPPTLRAAIPSANPSAYIGSSTSIGTPVAVAICIPLFVALANVVFDM
ncbi:MAG: sodium-dependent bicarbonate transport family permease [Alphaproteobacteria bacterium]|nr:sodium-dependent bicarbonate transport family permease [Alphaproteobacteria bacterium]